LLAKAVSGALGSERGLTTVDPEGEFARPLARVTASRPQISTPHGARHRDIRQSFSIVAWPVAWVADR